MPLLPNRKSLEAMKRVDVQKLCKDYGVKANLKTETLIDLLLEASRPPPPTHPPPQRSVSTRISSRAGARSRGRSGGSMIIHDTDDEDKDEPDEAEPEPVASEPPSEPEPTPPPATRTRKAKDMQTRLGVGRPVAAGGSGARAITKSLSVSKGKRGKSKSMKVVEATIPEEDEPAAASPIPIDPSDPGHAGTKHYGEPPQEPTVSDVGPLAALGDIDQLVTNALRPLHEQIQSLKSQLEEMQTLEAEVKRLTVRLANIDDLQRKVHTLTAELEDLRSQNATGSALNAEIKQLKETVSASLRVAEKARARNPSTPLSTHLNSPAKKTSASGPSVSTTEHDASCSNSAALHASTSNLIQVHPGIARTTLGKRQRDSIASDFTGVIEEGQEEEFSQEELAKRVVRHTKKRARLSPGLDGDKTSGEAAGASDLHHTAALEEEEEGFESGPALRVPSFTVFSGPDEPPENYLDPPPPSAHLPDFFGPPSPPGSSRPTTSTAQASENQNPFTFSFLATTSTPTNPMYPPTMPSFPYPEAPQSPSPAGPSTVTGFSRHPGERRQAHHDLFQSFVIPRRPGSAAASGSSLEDAPGAFINPAALTRPSRPSDREVSSNDGPGTARVASDAAAEQAAPTMKKTMYGTELDGDTRFGDFGVEGVASGYWAGKGY